MDIAGLIPIADSWSMHGGGAGWWIPMMAFMVLFWGAVIYGIVWISGGAGRTSGTPTTRTPTEILDARFAEGVFSVDDYHARKKVLAGDDRAHEGT